MSVPRLERGRATGSLLYDAAQMWFDDRALRLGAGVAYYALFALVPVFFLAISFASFFFGELARTDAEEWLRDFIGPDGTAVVVQAVDSIDIGETRSIVPVIALGVLLFTATLLSVAFKEVVDLLWGIPRARGFRASLGRRVRARLFGVAAVFGAGALLTLNLAIGSVIGFVDQLVENRILDALMRITGSFAVVALGAVFIAILFRFTPDVDVPWRSVWFAAIVTMALLWVGAWGYGVYLHAYGLSTATGAAGSLMLGLAFVYYSAGILLYGMEIVRLAHSRDGFVPFALRQKPGDGPQKE